MSYEIVLIAESRGSTYQIKFDFPNKCPHCLSIVKPEIIYKGSYNQALDTKVAFLMSCPNCKQFFALEYSIKAPLSQNIYESMQTTYTYKQIAEYDLPEELSIISPTFKEIYIQALTAENDSLSQLTGIGYRKAIEFLIKDFLISEFPDDEDKFIKLPLGQAIEYIESSRIKTLAKASVWLGNDETHYSRKFLDKDITDMKSFLKALGYFISSELAAREAHEFINS